LRTDAYGAIRANEGLYLSSWGQLGASGDQLDLSPARDQIQSAYNLSDTLSQSASDHNADPFETLEGLKQAGDDADDRYGNSEQLADVDQSSARGASDAGGRGESARMKAPWLHLASPAGITMSTPESTHLVQGRSLSVSSGEDMSLAAGRSLIASISEKLSMFVYRAGIKLFAAKGKVEIQAQSDEMALTAQKDVKITSTEGRVQINAANGILLTSGGGYIRIEGGNVEIHGPGNIDVKGAQHMFDGPASMDMAMPELPEGQCEKQFAGADKSSSGSSPVGS
ncbi:type VI secretion system secreted protein VgrG, partial [Kushneria avicenniae]